MIQYKTTLTKQAADLLIRHKKGRTCKMNKVTNTYYYLSIVLSIHIYIYKTIFMQWPTLNMDSYLDVFQDYTP